MDDVMEYYLLVSKGELQRQSMVDHIYCFDGSYGSCPVLQITLSRTSLVRLID